MPVSRQTGCAVSLRMRAVRTHCCIKLGSFFHGTETASRQCDIFEWALNATATRPVMGELFNRATEIEGEGEREREREKERGESFF